VGLSSQMDTTLYGVGKAQYIRCD